ncbi:nuclear GTP-binding protein nug1 [Recurvomyces mirabilis]|uniref:Nuclear GTP-binding protein nug1 n=1 Tax=Recurvomyces mirabilis TaxID=574656 RepID=A0AAE0TR56_9PEZI|nr:nuclear GTP-binding protein nug1 [Recurvomyces mirabilis]KAK5160155.1 nuclear GTP-binding protein nug1 [Recurvomyces mirabilis]
MKVGKPTSKRQTVRLRHKIQKASNAKQKKDRKAAKKNPQWVSRLKKDPGIPNLFPYKAKVLAEIEESRRRKEEDAQQRREIAKAQRTGRVVDAKGAAVPVMGDEDEDEDDDDMLLDLAGDDVEGEEGDEMEVQDESNPMAALLASAQARAQTFGNDDLAEDEDGEEEDDDDNDDEEEGNEEGNDEWGGIPINPTTTTKTSKNSNPTTTPTSQPTRKPLPKLALQDPIKAITTLIIQMQKTTDGIQRLITHYQIPPLVTAGSDTTTRFLVDVARKRGRLGRGGVPNLNAAALCVLGDLNEGRVVLPSVSASSKSEGAGAGAGAGVGSKRMGAGVGAAGKGGDVLERGRVVQGVSVVAEMAKPFSIEGLFLGDAAKSGGDERMDV